MDQAIQDEVRRKMGDGGRDKFSMLIPDTDEAHAELLALVGEIASEVGGWWTDGGPRESIGGGRQRVHFKRMKS